MLECKDVRFSYRGGIAALQGVSLRVGEGETVSLVGPNGAGKTTLARLVSGVLGPYGGDVLYHGRSLRGLSPAAIVRMGLVHVPEGRHLFPALDVETNLLLGGIRRSWTRKRLSSELERVYEIFPPLRDRRAQLAGTLSGGEQQMVAIGRALMGAPRLLILDEPTMGLAPKVVSAIFDVLLRLRSLGEGLAIFLIEQNAELALGISDRGYVLEAGVVRAEGKSKELLARSELRSIYIG
jgi:branched-chain amino acid transport system ATP-binding protein